MTENKSWVNMKLTKEFLEYIDHNLNVFHHLIEDKCNLNALLFTVNRRLSEVDTKISLTFHDEWKGESINEDGLKYLFKFDQWLRKWRQDMKFQSKIIEQPLNAFKDYIIEEMELHEDGVF